MILLSEHTVTIKINHLIICNNIKAYISLGIGMCLFLSNVSDSVLICFFYIYFIYSITRQIMVTVGIIPPSVNLLISRV